MSRFYEMSVEVSGHDRRRWPKSKRRQNRNGRLTTGGLPATSERRQTMHASAQDNCAAAKAKKQFTERLSLAIWRANGGYCHVSVDATYLENLPYETHALDEADYARLIQDDHNPSTGEAQT